MTQGDGPAGYRNLAENGLGKSYPVQLKKLLQGSLQCRFLSPSGQWPTVLFKGFSFPC